MKNKKVMSLAIDPDLHHELKTYAKKKGLTVSSYLGILISKAIKLPLDDDPIVIGKPAEEDVVPVVLKVPSELKGKKEELEKWISSQSSAIVDRLVK